MIVSKKPLTLFTLLALSTGLLGSSLPAYADPASDYQRAFVDAVSPASSGTDIKAQIVIVTTDHQVETIDVTNSSETVSSLLKKRGLSPDNLKTAESKPVDPKGKLTNGQILLLFESKSDAKVETVTLERPVISKPSDDLYVGETEVETEGADGQAIKTTVTTTDTSADKETNVATVSKESSPTKTEEKLTVVKAPVARVILEGTKERPAARSAATYGDYRSNSRPFDSVPPADADRSNKAVSLALAQLGKPYIWGATGPGGFDCSGLIYWIYHTNLGLNIPRTADAQGYASKHVSYDDIQPGDILWTNSHIMLYVGGNSVVHAANPNAGVTTTTLSYAKSAGYRVGRF